MDLNAASVRNDILKALKPHQNLLAVSKLQSVEKIKMLHNQGQAHFAENYIQEALGKMEALKQFPLSWHLIGPIQKNKIKYLKNNFSYLHAVDSVELAKAISSKAMEINYRQKVFIQINLALENSKSGFSKTQFLNNWHHLKLLPGLEIVGLMTMPPLNNTTENASENRKYFKELKEIGQSLGLSEFSMGTSQDYLIALEEGATWIRIGTLLFGERERLINNESRSQ